MAGLKTNEREGTRAVLRHARVSPYKVREVLDLVRGRPVHEAEDILRFSDATRPRPSARCCVRPWPTPKTTTSSTPRSSTWPPVSRMRAPRSNAGGPGPGAGRPGSASAPATSPSSWAACPSRSCSDCRPVAGPSSWPSGPDGWPGLAGPRVIGGRGPSAATAVPPWRSPRTEPLEEAQSDEAQSEERRVGPEAEATGIEDAGVEPEVTGQPEARASDSAEAADDAPAPSADDEIPPATTAEPTGGDASSESDAPVDDDERDEP